MPFQHWLSTVATNHDVLVYGAIYILAFIEGHLISIVCGFLAQQGYLYAVFAGIAIALGNLTGDVLMYWLGYYEGERVALSWGKYLGITEKSIATAKRIFHKYHTPILLGSKLSNGFGVAVAILFTAGMSRISFVRYMVLNVIGEALWTGGLILVGYYFGQFYTQISGINGKITLIAGCLIVAFIIVRVVITLRKKFLQNL